MSDVGQYLWANYFTKYEEARKHNPDIETLEANLKGLDDHLIVLRNKKGIKGVAVYLTLSDESYARLVDLDITMVDVVRQLVREHGPNVHIVLVAGGGVATLRIGIAEIKRRLMPKTISWWNPTMTKLHKYKVRG